MVETLSLTRYLSPDATMKGFETRTKGISQSYEGRRLLGWGERSEIGYVGPRKMKALFAIRIADLAKRWNTRKILASVLFSCQKVLESIQSRSEVDIVYLTRRVPSLATTAIIQ